MAENPNDDREDAVSTHSGEGSPDTFLADSEEVIVPKCFKKFKAHQFTITAASITTRGHRIATGDTHGFVRLRDFKNLDCDGERYSEFLPAENHAVSVIEWSRDSKHLIICNSEKILRVFDSHMNPIVKTYRGDMYVRDTAQTTGHTHSINDVKWDPTDFSHFASASLDGSVRIWDTNSKPQGLDRAIPSLLVLRAVNHRGSCMSQECSVTSITYLDGNNTIAGVCADGSVQIWDARLTGAKTRKSKSVNRGSHESSIPVKICQVRGGERIFSRSADYIVAHDIRQMKTPLVKKELIADNPKCPEIVPFKFGLWLITTCKANATNASALAYVDSGTLEIVDEVECAEMHNCTAIKTCEGMGQVFTADSNGNVVGFYDEAHNRRFSGLEGILAVKDAEQPKEKKKTEEEDASGIIDSSHSWYELPSNIKQFRDGTIREIKPRRHVLRAEANPSLTRSQQFGESEPVLKMTMAQSVMKKFLQEEAAIRGDDSNWIDTLRRGGSPQDEPPEVSLVNRAYRKTQPTLLLDMSEAVGGEKMLEGQRKCPQCGLKMCTCGYVSMLTGRGTDFSEQIANKKYKQS